VIYFAFSQNETGYTYSIDPTKDNLVMKKDLKIAIIGAGSSYTPELIDGLIARSSQLPISEVRLVDIDEGWHKAEIILSLA
jgi:6-phospho-beta-glucosidase